MTNTDNVNKDTFKPIIFLNTPIASDDADVIGIESSVLSIKTAINNGANMIGVLADYGTGKSSLTQYLVDNEPNYHAININMWDCLNQKDISSSSTEDIPTLSKSFLYQLAVNSTEKRGSSTFARHINKRLSKNYGLISFSVISIKQWIFFILAALSYSIYEIFNKASFLNIKSIINNDTISRLIVTICPLFLVLAITIFIWGVRKSSIAFSHWKEQSQKSKDVNDVFDVYDEIAYKLTKTHKKQKHIIIVEDLDRVADKDIVIGFLKELYRFQNLLTNRQKRRMVFVVSVKPEAMLIDYKPQKLQEPEEYQNFHRTDFEHNTYDKLFDYSISLKPLHFEDYEAIILSIINNDINKKSDLEKLLEYDINEKLSKDFYWITKGQNLTIRNLKNRLNQAVSLMVTLKNKNYTLQSKNAINFSTCAAVTYLEQTYEKQYYETIKHESKLAEIIRNSYEIRNSNAKTDEKQEQLISSLGYFIGYGVSHEFIKDISSLILEGTIDDDFRMYLYNYPKGSHIKTSDEKDLSDLLLLPEEHPMDNLLSEKVDRILEINQDKNIIIDCLERINKQPGITFPSIIIENEYLFKAAKKININRTTNTVMKNAPWTDEKFKQSETTIRMISKFSEETRMEFYLSYCSCLEKNFLSLENDQIVRIRLALIEIINIEVGLFKNLFLPIEKTSLDEEKNSDVPFITQEEVVGIDDTSLLISLIDMDKVTEENINYISQNLNSHKLSNTELRNAEKFYHSIFEKIELEVAAPILLDFLTINNFVNAHFFGIIVKWISSILYKDESSIKFFGYINNLEEVPIEYLNKINDLCIFEGLSEQVLLKLNEHKLFSTFLCSMYKAERLMEIEYNNDGTILPICNACKHINETFADIDDLLISIRLSVLQTKIELAPKYTVLFMKEYPLISKDELLIFKDISSALPYIFIDVINDDNYKNVIEFMNATERAGSECYEFFEYMFQQNTIKDKLVSMKIIQEIDYDNVKYYEMSEEEKNNIALTFSDIMQFSESKNCLEFMALTKSLTPVLEEEVINAGMDDEYIELINNLNQSTSFTIQWLSNKEVTYELNEKLTGDLLEKGKYESYIVGKTLFDGELTFNTEKVPFDFYLSVYIKHDNVFKIMQNHYEFLQKVVSNGKFNDLTPDRIMPLTKYRQPINLVLHAFKTMLPEQIEEYLYAFEHLNEETDSEAFLRYIKTGENYKSLPNYRGRRRAWELIWKPSDRQKLTKYMRKFFPSDNYRIDSNEFEFLD